MKPDQISFVVALSITFLVWRSRFGCTRDNIASYDLMMGRSPEQTIEDDCRMGMNLSDVKRRHKGNDQFKWDVNAVAYKDACRRGRDRFRIEGRSDVLNPDKEKCANTKKRNGKQLSGKLCNITGLKRMMPCKGILKGECCDYWSNCLTQDDIKSTQKSNKWAVTLYEEPNYGGESLRITLRTHPAVLAGLDLKTLGWNNRASSVKISGDVEYVLLSKEPRMQGHIISLQKSEKDLGYYKDYGYYKDIGTRESENQCGKNNNGCFNRTASSIKVKAPE